MHVVSSNALLQMIKLKCKIWKILIAFTDDVRWIRRCIFEIAHVSHWTIFEAFSWVISISSIFLNWLIISDRQCFKRKCQFLIDNVLNANVNFKKSSSLRCFCEIELHWRTFRLINISRKTSHVFSQYRRSLRQLIYSSVLFYTCFIQSFAF
jgi:hypothetical protein